MSEALLIWLFGILGGWMLAITIGGFRLHLAVTEVKAILRMTSKRAAEILHSPDDHLGVDKLLDLYIEKENELTTEQWQQLHDAMEKIIADLNVSKQERSLALWVSAFSSNKLKLRR